MGVDVEDMAVTPDPTSYHAAKRYRNCTILGIRQMRIHVSLFLVFGNDLCPSCARSTLKGFLILGTRVAPSSVQFKHTI